MNCVFSLLCVSKQYVHVHMCVCVFTILIRISTVWMNMWYKLIFPVELLKKIKSPPSAFLNFRHKQHVASNHWTGSDGSACFKSLVWFNWFETLSCPFCMACKASKRLTAERPPPSQVAKKVSSATYWTTENFRRPPAARCLHWPLPPSASSRQPLRQWSSLPKAPWDCSSSYSWSRKSRLLLLGNPRMVNLWDTLVHCSRFAATLSYSSVAPGNSSDSSLKGQRTGHELRCSCLLFWDFVKRGFHMSTAH